MLFSGYFLLKFMRRIVDTVETDVGLSEWQISSGDAIPQMYALTRA